MPTDDDPMINPQLYKTPVALDRDRHRGLQVSGEVNGLLAAAALNAFFVAGVEFIDVCREYPIVFVRAGDNPATGQPDIAPMAVFGLATGENLFIEGGRWTADYVPALLRAYPFAIAPVDAERYTVVIDESWPGLGVGTGRALFEADGAPTAYLREVQQYLENLEREVQRTRAVGQRLAELGLLRDTRFEATLPDGQGLSVDGFMVIDEAKFAALSDALVLELHHAGILGLVQSHRVSMGNMRRLVALRQRRAATA